MLQGLVSMQHIHTLPSRIPVRSGVVNVRLLAQGPAICAGVVIQPLLSTTQQQSLRVAPPQQAATGPPPVSIRQQQQVCAVSPFSVCQKLKCY